MLRCGIIIPLSGPGKARREKRKDKQDIKKINHMNKNAILLILFAFVVLAMLCFRGLNGEDPAPVPGLEPARPSRAGEFRGISLQLHTGDDNHPHEFFISEIARTGANTICFVFHGYQEHAGSKSIFVDTRKVPSDRRLRKMIDHAHKKGLRVILMPVVLLAKRRENEWRGKINPGNWDSWWKDYSQFILRYAKLAESGKAEVFSVGSELISTETQTDRWKKLIAEVRKVYSGRLTYSANWDHYQAPKWWDDLDIVGMTSYYTLAKGTNPSLADLKKTWAGIRKKVLAWQKTVNRPILFTEVGWPNQVTAAEFPWNYYAATDKPDPKLQARCFEAFFETWKGEPAVAGYLIWEWRTYPKKNLDPQKDTSYCPAGKPAMKIISKYLQMPVPKILKKQTTTTTAPITASQPTTKKHN